MDMNKNRVSKEPAFEISIEAAQAFLKQSKSDKELEKFKAFIEPETHDFHFHPSALAVHPISNDIYIMSSKGKTMIVLNNRGEIISFEKLKKKIHPQPEGIAFDKNGTMYISNEGKKGGNGRICVFHYKKP